MSPYIHRTLPHDPSPAFSVTLRITLISLLSHPTVLIQVIRTALLVLSLTTHYMLCKHTSCIVHPMQLQLNPQCYNVGRLHSCQRTLLISGATLKSQSHNGYISDTWIYLEFSLEHCYMECNAYNVLQTHITDPLYTRHSYLVIHHQPSR